MKSTKTVLAVATTGIGLIVCGCSAGTIAEIGKSPIGAGIYTGTRECTSTVNGQTSTQNDTIRFTIDNDGLLVLNGNTIHIGLVNEFDTGAASQSSVIQAITVTDDGFTIDWDTTLVVEGTTLTGFVLESFTTEGGDSVEFQSTLLASTSGVNYWSDCVSVITR